MNDQQRSTPQPFDDGPRMDVDPHLLPPAARKPRPAATGTATPESDRQDSAAPEYTRDHAAVHDTDAIDTSEFEHADAHAGAHADRGAPIEREIPVDRGANAEAPGAFSASAPEQPVPATDIPPEPGEQDAVHHEPEVQAAESQAADPNYIAESDVAEEPAADASADTAVAGAAAAGAAGAAGSQSRLDEAVQRSRAIPYEERATRERTTDTNESVSDVAATDTDALDDQDAATRDGHRHDTDADGAALVTADGTDADRTDRADADTAEAEDPTAVYSTVTEEELREDERRREDDEFSETMLGSTSTEGLIIPPQKRGNRTFALIGAVITTIIFAVLYALVFAGARFLVTSGADFLGDAWAFVGTAAFYVPVAFFGIVMILWSVLSNRAGWWSFILASFFLAVIAFGGHYVGLAGQEVINGQPWSNEHFLNLLTSPEHLPGALIAFITARESANWVGGLIAARGRRVKRLNQRDQDEYDRRVEEERKASAIANNEPIEVER
ncbi:MAG: hypothetical protein ACTHXA_11625 [Gulosibacter sp.]|uniref:hypothetical protein n=1 Tax=Gulosibacter sp. TaxID=2817531 RepID=UPI003F8F1CF6